MVLREMLSDGVDYLSKRGVVHARREVEDIFAHVLRLSRGDIYLQSDRVISEEEKIAFDKIIFRRGNKEPLQYIIGQVDFYDCKIKVNRDVLIPRQETELFVDLVVKDIAGECDGKELWDICTGSGCIGIALKKRFPKLNVSISDKSSRALEVAASNAVENDVKVNILHGDLLNPFEGLQTDYIVCNPPYVSNEEWSFLEKEVRDHEPKEALLASGAGLKFYQRLALSLDKYLKPCGKAWFEIGESQGKALLDLFCKKPWVKTCRVHQDLSGKDRIFCLEIE